MNQKDYQVKFERLLDKVRQMRGVQKEYLKYRASADLERLKRLSKELDHMIEDEVKIKKSGQKELF